MKKFLLFLLISIFLFSNIPTAKASKKHIHPEKDYQNQWCKIHHGTTEVILHDKTRVDCLTHTHAIEFDFAAKWAESIGQALYYAEVTNKKPGIVLIIEDKTKDNKYVKRANTIAKEKPTLFKEIIDVYMKKRNLTSLEEAANAVNIGIDVLKNFFYSPYIT